MGTYVTACPSSVRETGTARSSRKRVRADGIWVHKERYAPRTAVSMVTDIRTRSQTAKADLPQQDGATLRRHLAYLIANGGTVPRGSREPSSDTPRSDIIHR